MVSRTHKQTVEPLSDYGHWIIDTVNSTCSLLQPVHTATPPDTYTTQYTALLTRLYKLAQLNTLSTNVRSIDIDYRHAQQLYKFVADFNDTIIYTLLHPFINYDTTTTQQPTDAHNYSAAATLKYTINHIKYKEAAYRPIYQTVTLLYKYITLQLGTHDFAAGLQQCADVHRLLSVIQIALNGGSESDALKSRAWQYSTSPSLFEFHSLAVQFYTTYCQLCLLVRRDTSDTQTRQQLTVLNDLAVNSARAGAISSTYCGREAQQRDKCIDEMRSFAQADADEYESEILCDVKPGMYLIFACTLFQAIHPIVSKYSWSPQLF